MKLVYRLAVLWMILYWLLVIGCQDPVTSSEFVCPAECGEEEGVCFCVGVE